MSNETPADGDGPAYDNIVKQLATDGARTRRQREVEACFGQGLPTLLRELEQECSSKSAMLRRINETLAANGIDKQMSRGTLYNWLGELEQDAGEEDDGRGD